MNKFKVYEAVLDSLTDEETVKFLRNDDNRSAARKISDAVEKFLNESQ